MEAEKRYRMSTKHGIPLDRTTWTKEEKARFKALDHEHKCSFVRCEYGQEEPDSITYTQTTDRKPHVRFRAFHEENPDIFLKIVELARQARNAGHQRYSIQTIWEIMRWHFGIEKRRGEKWTLNNNYRADYSRLVMQTIPDLKDFFETREQK
jgi:hypothetical protein